MAVLNSLNRELTRSGLGDFVAESFSRQVMSGPECRIAAACVAANLIAVGEGKDGVQNRAVRQVPGLDVRQDGERVPFSGTREPQPSQQQRQASTG